MDAAKSARPLDALLALAVVGLAVLLASFAAGGATNPDLWYHLAAGRLVANGTFPFGLDPFSALDPAPPWVHHAWLFDLLLYLTYRGLGGAAVVAAKAGLVALTALALLRTRRPGGDGLWPAVATTLALLAVSPRLGLQPVIASYLAFAILQYALTRPPAVRRWPLPVFCGVLFALWVNLDGGFWFGLALIAVRIVGALLDRALPLSDASAADATPGVGELAAALAAALAGCLVSPYLLAGLTSLPTEFAFLGLPADLRGERLFAGYFRSPFSDEYARAAGLVAVAAYGVLLVGGAAAFFLNAAGWHWGRVLAWFTFVAASLFYPRALPYAALVAGPALAVGVQAAWSRWFAGRRDKLTPEGKHVLAFAATFGRVVPLLAVVVLGCLAWPGWLAGESGGLKELRRVRWEVTPDPTNERLAKQLATWYADGRLPPEGVRGFFLNPELSYYCAWFCPQQKSLYDLRLTAPPEVLADCLAARKGVSNLRGGAEAGDAAPEPILAKYRVEFLAAVGEPLLESGLAQALLARSAQWPLWAVAGHGAAFGFRADPAAPDPHPHLHADAVALALNPAEPLPAPPNVPPPGAPDFWHRYLFGLAPVPADAYEAALWLAARDAAQSRFMMATLAWQTAGAVGQSAPAGGIRPVEPLTLALAGTNAFAGGVSYDAWRRFAPDGKRGRAAALLAVRAARRGVAQNPDDYEAYLRLAQAYSVMDSDASFTTTQRLVAARQALLRVPYGESYGQDLTAATVVLNELLLELYKQTPILPGSQLPALDLLAEAAKGRLESARARLARFGKPADSVPKPFIEEAEKLREQVQKLSDDYETAARTAAPALRARLAVSRGLAREAIKVLRESDPKDIDPATVEMGAHLFLLAGEADAAAELTEKLTAAQGGRASGQGLEFGVKVAAARGDYAAGVATLDQGVERVNEAIAEPLARTLLWLHFADAPATALARLGTCPLWGGVWSKEGQLRNPGTLILLLTAAQQRFDWQAQAAMLELERGDVAAARRRFAAAVRPPAGPPLPFQWRPVAVRWLGLLDVKPARGAE